MVFRLAAQQEPNEKTGTLDETAGQLKHQSFMVDGYP